MPSATLRLLTAAAAAAMAMLACLLGAASAGEPLSPGGGGPALMEVAAQAATAAHAQALAALDNRLDLQSGAGARGIDSHDFGFESVMSDSTMQAMRARTTPTARSNYGSISMVSGSLEVPAFKPWIKVGGSASLTGMHKTGTTVVSGAVQLKLGVDFGFFTLFGFFNGNLYATSHDTHEVGGLVAAVVAELVAGEAAKPADYFLGAVNWGPHGELSEAILRLEQRRRATARSALVASRRNRWNLEDERRLLGMSIDGDSVEKSVLALRRHYDEFGQAVTKRVYEAMRRRIRAASRWKQEKQLRKFGATVAPGAQDALKRAMDQMARLIAREVLGEERSLCLRLVRAIEENRGAAERTGLLHRLVRDITDEDVPPPGKEHLLHMNYREQLGERAANTEMIQRLKALIRARLSTDVSTPGEAPKRLPELDRARVTFDVYGELGVQGTVKVDKKKLPKVKRIGDSFKLEGSLAAAAVPFGVRGEVDLNEPRSADNYRVAYSGRSFAVELILGGFNGLVKVVERDFPSGATDFVWFVKLFYEHEALSAPGGKASLTKVLTDVAIFANVLHAGREIGGAVAYATSGGHISDADPGPVGNANRNARVSFDSKARAMLHGLEGAFSSQQARDFGAAMGALGVEIVRRQKGLSAGVPGYSTKIQMGAMVVVQVRNNVYKPSEMAKRGGSPLVPNAKAKFAPLFFTQAQAGWDTEENAVLGKLPFKGSIKSARGIIAAMTM